MLLNNQIIRRVEFIRKTSTILIIEDILCIKCLIGRSDVLNSFFCKP